MSDEAWLVQIYQMTDEGTQSSAVSLLSGLGGLSVDARTCERGSFLIVECQATAASAVFEMVVMIDANAELIHSTTGSASASSPV